MKISELIDQLSTIHEQEGDLDIFGSLGKRTAEFLVADAAFAERNDPRWPVTAGQEWLPPRVILSLKNI